MITTYKKSNTALVIKLVICLTLIPLMYIVLHLIEGYSTAVKTILFYLTVLSVIYINVKLILKIWSKNEESIIIIYDNSIPVHIHVICKESKFNLQISEVKEYTIRSNKLYIRTELKTKSVDIKDFTTKTIEDLVKCIERGTNFGCKRV